MRSLDEHRAGSSGLWGWEEVTITLYDDGGIATIDKEEVYVPVGSDGTPAINLNFKIPEDAEVGHVYDIRLNFRGIPDVRVGGERLEV